MHDDLSADRPAGPPADGPAVRPRHALGDLALAAGVGALGVTVLPVIGEVLAVPVGILALTLGLVGLGRWERGLEHGPVRAAAGALLGAAALVVVLVVVLAAH